MGWSILNRACNRMSSCTLSSLGEKRWAMDYPALHLRVVWDLGTPCWTVDSLQHSKIKSLLESVYRLLLVLSCILLYVLWVNTFHHYFCFHNWDRFMYRVLWFPQSYQTLSSIINCNLGVQHNTSGVKIINEETK